ncbi:WhiB family transcriptional regulator [Actinosynnema sp. NPDC023587]|uniref:WhiB family transcriptional regulator n=1 Tax=Actinosynnema sp. NPDC023587 TaxID=3154695 RepID=UPI0033D5FC99
MTVAIAAPRRLVPREVPDWHEAGICRAFPELSWVHPGAADPFSRPLKAEREVAELACRVICAACPVRLACALGALERGERWGIWGGLDFTDRKAVAKEFGYELPGAAPEHGTNSRYAKWSCRCPDCREAHALYESQRRPRAAQRRLAVADEPPVPVRARPVRLDLVAYRRRTRRRAARR